MMEKSFKPPLARFVIEEATIQQMLRNKEESNQILDSSQHMNFMHEKKFLGISKGVLFWTNLTNLTMLV